MRVSHTSLLEDYKSSNYNQFLFHYRAWSLVSRENGELQNLYETILESSKETVRIVFAMVISCSRTLEMEKLWHFSTSAKQIKSWMPIKFWMSNSKSEQKAQWHAHTLYTLGSTSIWGYYYPRKLEGRM